MIALLKERFVCVQEIIPGAETTPADLAPERRKLLEPFAHNGRFFFGTVRILSFDGKDVLAALRSFPRAAENTRAQDGQRFLALAKDVLAGKATPLAAQKGPPFLQGAPLFKKDGPPFKKDGLPYLKGAPRFKGDGPPFNKDSPRGFGPRQGGPKLGAQAPAFELKFLDSKETFRLSDNLGKRATVLIFHSFT